jgi:long-chain fatty acid transport protein
VLLKRSILGAAALALALSQAQPAAAAGLYFADRGVRPLGRAGAFVAGADDLGAIAYNPAGLFDAGGQVLVDGTWLHFTSDYTRQALLQQTDPNSGKPVGAPTKQTFAPVSGTTPFLPIPTLAVSFQVHPKVVVAVGAFAPYAALTTYPGPDDFKGKSNAEIANNTPQRYSLVTLDGSALAILAAGAAFAPIKEIRLGATVGMLTGKFSTTVAFSGCVPEKFTCAPESPSWDVLSQLSVGPIFSPYGSFGAIFIPHPSWRIGISSQLPIYVRASATVKTRLPATPFFEKATQNGDQADVAFDLPWNLKFGVETRAVKDLRLEAGFGFERWSMHDAIRMTPHGIALENVALIGTTFIPPISLPRNFKDSVSVRLGGEYAIPLKSVTLVPRAGVSFETSAVPNQYLSVLTIDANKVTAALGGSLHYGKWRFDVAYAHVFAFTTTVDPADAKITQVSPVNANPPAQPDYINGGVYAARADAIGLGMAYTFGGPVPEEALVSAGEGLPEPAKK